MRTCTICQTKVNFENCDGGICDVCDSLVCDNCTDWKNVLIEPHNYDVLCTQCSKESQNNSMVSRK